MMRSRRGAFGYRRVIPFLGAVAIVFLSASPVWAQVDAPAPPAGGQPAPAAADPNAPPADPNSMAACAKSDVGPCPAAQQKINQTPQAASPIAAQCNSDTKVPDQWSNTWVGLTPATLGCGAITSLDWTVRELGISLDNTKVDLIEGTHQNNGKWFQIEFGLIEMMAIWTIPPIFFISVIHAVSSGHYDRLLKTALVYLPISLFGTAIAMFAVQQVLNVTDDISDTFLQSVQADAQAFFVAIAQGFGPKGFVINGGAWVMSLILALGLLLATMVVYIVLTVRESAIYIAVLFLPIVFAMLIWPPLQKYFKRLIEFLIGMILSKIVMVAAIALMVSVMAATAGIGTTQTNSLGLGQTSLTAADGPAIGMWTWVTMTVTNIFMFFIFMFAPNMCSKLVSNVAYEETGSTQAANQNRPNTHRKIDWLNREIGVLTQARATWNNFRDLAAARQAGANDPPGERLRNDIGLARTARPVTDERARSRGYRPNRRDDSMEEVYTQAGYDAVMTWGNTGQYDDERAADALLLIGADRLEQIDINEGETTRTLQGREGEIPTDIGVGGYRRFTWNRTTATGQTVLRSDILINGFDENNNVLQTLTPQMIEAAIQETLDVMPLSEQRVDEIVVHLPIVKDSVISQQQIDQIAAKFDKRVEINISGTPRNAPSGNGTARERNPAFRK